MKVNSIVMLKNYSTNNTGAVNVTLEATRDEILNSMKLIAGINQNLTVQAKIPGEKPFQVGNFSVKNVSFNKDGVSTIKLISLTQAIESGSLEKLVRDQYFNIRYIFPDEEEEEEEGEQ